MKKQFGKKVDKWPDEQRRALRTAHERLSATDAERIFLGGEPNLPDSVEDLRRHLASSKRLHVAANVAEAHRPSFRHSC